MTTPHYSTFRLLALLSFPFIVFGAVVGVATFLHARAMDALMGISALHVETYVIDLEIIITAFIVCFAIELFIFFRAIHAYIAKADSLFQLSKEQERGAQLLIRRDVELTRANDQLRKLDEAKSNFITVAAHQLRTPLSGIKWTLNLLMGGDVGALPTSQQTLLMKAYESNERMIGLVNDMLDADRIDSGKMHYAPVPIQLTDVLDNVLFELLPQANAKGVSIHLAPPPGGAPKVHADPEKLRAVFQNLVDNAVKYSRPRGTVEVGMAVAEGGRMRIWVKDDGIGIPQEQQHSIFERFFRARNAVKAETNGSGLGLFIVKSIVEKHGGRIWFESAEGHGTTFFFTIPIV